MAQPPAPSSPYLSSSPNLSFLQQQQQQQQQQATTAFQGLTVQQQQQLQQNPQLLQAYLATRQLQQQQAKPAPIQLPATAVGATSSIASSIQLPPSVAKLSRDGELDGELVQKLLDENALLIQSITDFQNVKKPEECNILQQRLHENLSFLAKVADSIPETQSQMASIAAEEKQQQPMPLSVPTSKPIASAASKNQQPVKPSPYPMTSTFPSGHLGSASSVSLMQQQLQQQHHAAFMSMQQQQHQATKQMSSFNPASSSSVAPFSSNPTLRMPSSATSSSNTGSVAIPGSSPSSSSSAASSPFIQTSPTQQPLLLPNGAYRQAMNASHLYPHHHQLSTLTSSATGASSLSSSPLLQAQSLLLTSTAQASSSPAAIATLQHSPPQFRQQMFPQAASSTSSHHPNFDAMVANLDLPLPHQTTLPPSAAAGMTSSASAPSSATSTSHMLHPHQQH